MQLDLINKLGKQATIDNIKGLRTVIRLWASGLIYLWTLHTRTILGINLSSSTLCYAEECTKEHKNSLEDQRNNGHVIEQLKWDLVFMLLFSLQTHVSLFDWFVWKAFKFVYTRMSLGRKYEISAFINFIQ